MTFDSQLRDASLGHAAPAAGRRWASSWGSRLRVLMVSRGIEMVCGRANAVDPAVASDIHLISSAARMAWLKVLAAVGVRDFVAKSGLGYDFVCHVGDLAGFPFYYRRAHRAELQLCAAWLQHDECPVVYDVGANCGFVATQLAQMLADRKPSIHAFEPVPSTMEKLVRSVRLLGLSERVHPVAAAVVDHSGSVRISYSERNSLEAQVGNGSLNTRVGDKVAVATGMTLDGFCASANALPGLVKIDAEGSEAAVLRGARNMLSQPGRPAILFEFNPVTLAECGTTTRELLDELTGYALYYVDDLRGQVIPFGRAVPDAERIDWICNLFAVPLTAESAGRWARVSKQMTCATAA